MTEAVDNPEPLRAAGVMFLSADGRVLLARRTGEDHKGEWAFPGGGIEAGETAERAARREVLEEFGIDIREALPLLTRRIKDGVDFSTFLARVENTFDPTLNPEHDRYAWMPVPFALTGTSLLHPGCVVSLRRLGMNELDIAKAIRDGELVSPQRFTSFLLIALRITGTGASYRKGVKEYVWRDPSLYLNPTFLERCNGLPVILDHQEEGALSSEEFHRRIVGMIVLPYLQGDEVWGIARIYDAATAEMLQTMELSTSPAVVFAEGQEGEKITTSEGDRVLLEGDPPLLDSLAICKKGVWDKGLPASGVDSVTVQADSELDIRLDVALEMLNSSTVNNLCRRLGA